MTNATYGRSGLNSQDLQRWGRLMGVTCDYTGMTQLEVWQDVKKRSRPTTNDSPTMPERIYAIGKLLEDHCGESEVYEFFACIN